MRDFSPNGREEKGSEKIPFPSVEENRKELGAAVVHLNSRVEGGRGRRRNFFSDPSVARCLLALLNIQACNTISAV